MNPLPTPTAVCRSCILRSLAHSAPRAAARPFSVLHRPKPNYDGHVPLAPLERAALAVGSGVMAFLNPRRAGKSKPATDRGT
jgi:ubiquinone biosynthesis protein COQ4